MFTSRSAFPKRLVFFSTLSQNSLKPLTHCSRKPMLILLIALQLKVLVFIRTMKLRSDFVCCQGLLDPLKHCSRKLEPTMFMALQLKVLGPMRTMGPRSDSKINRASMILLLSSPFDLQLSVVLFIPLYIPLLSPCLAVLLVRRFAFLGFPIMCLLITFRPSSFALLLRASVVTSWHFLVPRPFLLPLHPSPAQYGK